MAYRVKETLLERFADRVAWDGECLVWLRATTKGGYGLFQYAGTMLYAHRASWELYHGTEIPEGWHIDHRPGCQKHCVTPEHLTARDPSEHSRLGWGRGEITGDQRRKYSRVCSVEGCGRPHSSYGMCQMHRRRTQKHGDPLIR